MLDHGLNLHWNIPLSNTATRGRCSESNLSQMDLHFSYTTTKLTFIFLPSRLNFSPTSTTFHSVQPSCVLVELLASLLHCPSTLHEVLLRRSVRFPKTCQNLNKMTAEYRQKSMSVSECVSTIEHKWALRHWGIRTCCKLPSRLH